MNIYDIAQKAEVSIATVSRVLNGKDTVSDKTRKRVLDVMEEMGYTPNIFARGLGLNTIKMIGVMCNDVTDLYCSAALSVIEKEVRRNGYDVILCCTGDDLAVKKQYLSLLLSKRVDSLILIGSIFKSREDNSHIYEAAEKVPVVIINGYVEAPNIYCVLCDNYNATRDAVLRLAKKGHTRIAHMYRAQTYSGLEKINGYRDGLEEAGLPFDPALLAKVGAEPADDKGDDSQPGNYRRHFLLQRGGRRSHEGGDGAAQAGSSGLCGGGLRRHRPGPLHHAGAQLYRQPGGRAGNLGSAHRH